ncbi:autotransporter family protein [Mesorhizobium sp. NBSH29]|uniref:autotransporter family protein n=1 Tax=Mesorhizobium sp. NBSH29 TaxID=2654249 RepID=UPI0018964AED|nr:autotransporter outer membrane beta-barrel domain-containing protein [Mesorhizobium sp. NBSH29]
MHRFKSGLLSGASIGVLALMAPMAMTSPALAACADPVGQVVNCSGPITEFSPQDYTDDGMTINVSGDGGITASNKGTAIRLGDFAVIHAANESRIESVSESESPVILVGDDADLELGNVFTSGKKSGVSAGDRLHLLLREGGSITTMGSGIRAGTDANLQIDGAVTTEGGFFIGKPGDGVFLTSPSIEVGDRATITVSETGSINSAQDAIHLRFQENGGDDLVANISVQGEISAAHRGIYIVGGNLMESRTAFDAPPLEPARQRANITVGASGSITAASGQAVFIGGQVALDTTIRIAGTVQGERDLSSRPTAIQLNDGADTFIYEATANIVGDVYADTLFDREPDPDAGPDLTGKRDTFVLGGENDGSFDVSLLDGDGVYSDAEQFRGFDIFEKREGGTFFLSGSNTEIGNFSVLGGNLFANAEMASTAFNVASGAKLGGTGTIGSATILSGARLAPGNADASAFGTLSVRDSATFMEGAIFETRVDDTGNSDLLSVGGTAMIDGATMNIIATPGSYASQTYTVIEAEGGVTGKFASLSDNLQDIDFVDSYDGNTVKLGLIKAPVNQPNQPGAGTPGFSDKENALAAAFGAGDSSLQFSQMLAGRMSGGSTTTTASIGTPLGYDAPVTRSETFPAVHRVYGADFHSPAPITELGGLAVWVGALGLDASVDERDGVRGYDNTVGGIAGGIEYRMSGEGKGVIGLAGGYTRSTVDVINGGARINSAHVGIYAGYQIDALHLAGALAYSNGSYNLWRNVSGAVALGDTDGNALSGHVEAFYDLAPRFGLAEGTSVGPVARLRGANATRDGFTETGAGILNLTVAEDSVSQSYGDVGMRFATRYVVGALVLHPEIELRYERRLSSNSDISNAVIAPVAGAEFATTVQAGGRDRFGLGLGMGMDFNAALSAKLSYDGSFGKDVTSHAGALSLTYKF